MVRQILVVDDNQPFLNLLYKLFSRRQDSYAILTCNDGSKAIEHLKTKPIAMVVTDLQMPQVDGYALLGKLRKFFPDIPAIVATGYDKPKTREAVMRYGAAAYFTKPLVVEDLMETMEQLFAAQSSGGTLKNASLEMFLQLIEMESKTCTIRVFNEANEESGVLFFRDGDILNARIGAMNGNRAAYRILSWERVTLLIENSCVLTRKGIQGELQAILLDAMRLKDEIGAASEEPAADEAPARDPQEETPAYSMDDLTRLKRLLINLSGMADAIVDAKEADSLSDSVSSLQMLGNIIGAGPLKAIISEDGRGGKELVTASEPPLFLKASPRVGRDVLIETVLDF